MPPRPPRSRCQASPRQSAEAELVSYLTLLAKSVEEALHARKALLADLVQARQQPESALARAGHASSRCVRAFDDALTRLYRGRAPAAAAECALELRSWLEAHIEACDLLSRAAAARDLYDFHAAVRRLADGSMHAVGYNQARQRLARRLLAAS